MGEYFTPVVVDGKGSPVMYMNSHEYGSGTKIGEHSWLDNEFVQAFETLLIADSPVRVVWASDYSETGVYDRARGSQVYRPDTPALNSDRYGPADVPANAHPKIIPTSDSHPFLINVDKHEFVDKRHVPADGEWRIHPLPFLTAEPSSGARSRYSDPDGVVGSWCGDRLSLSESHPGSGYTEIAFRVGS